MKPPNLEYSRRWFALSVIAACQLLIVLGASVVNIALPQVQVALSISDANRQWVLTAYTLGVGSLLLLGGRVGDYVGRKRVLVLGLIGFAVASGIGGLAENGPTLYAARGLQGVFAAAIMPATLSLLSVTFDDRLERAKAFSVYGAMTGGGGAIGLLLGGVLTQYASWRWCLLVNVPFALLTAFLATRWLTESRAAERVHYDAWGSVTVTLGLIALVYGLSTAGVNGWTSVKTTALLAAAVVLLVVFVIIEARSRRPLLPLGVVMERNRGAAFMAIALAAAALFSMFLFLSYYFQGVLNYSAVNTGIAFLPISIATLFGTYFTSRLLPKFGSRNLLAPGMLASSLGLLWFTQIGVKTSFWLIVFPAELVVGLGMGLIFVTVASTALHGVVPDDSGVASALVSTSQQIGASLGTAFLNTLAAAATFRYAKLHVGVTASLVHGYQTAFRMSAVTLGVAAVGIALLIRAGRDELPG